MDTTEKLQRLQDTLDAYGGDPARWPEDRRASLAGLIAGDAAARRLVAEAKALDEVLEKAPVLAPRRRQALADRIVAEAIGNSTARRSVGPPRPASQRMGSSERTFAGMALAASLALGVMTGSGAVLAPAVDTLASQAGIDIASATGQVAANDDSFEISNEDLL